MTPIPKSILWIRGGPANGETINLAEDATLIGLTPDNNIVVDQPAVSRLHARIRSDANGYWLEDLGSRNGTFVNGTLVEGEGQRLRDRDRIEFELPPRKG